MSEGYTLGDLWACQCGRTAPYRCPACQVAHLETELEALRAELAARLPPANVRHLLDE